MNKRALWSGVLVCLLAASAFAQARQGARRKPQPKGAICGDPTVTCKTSAQFEPHDLPFRIPERAVLWESESFYAVILKSVKAPNDDCAQIVPETERQQAQTLFPHNKVFASRCADAGTPYYTSVKPDTHFMAVYAGRTRAEAEKVLAQVKATGQFADANLRRMSIGFNGT
jgi:hypothetical protein